MKNSYFYIAKVTDNKDKDGLNRVKVTSKFNNETVSSWIPCLTAMAGDEIGFTSLPDIDEQVLVLAFGEERYKQIVVGSFWSGNANPAESGENTDADLNGDGNNSLNFIKSRSGNMLIFDDTDAKEKIQMILSGNKTRIELDNESEKINIQTDKDFALSAKGSVSIQTEEEINMKAKKSITLKSDDLKVKTKKEIGIEANNDISIKGSSIDLN